MTRLLRTFVALRCGPSVTRRLRRECDELERVGGDFRAPRTDDFHTTLHFLGDTDEGDLGAIGRALEAAATAVGPLELAYGGLGAFPEPSRARVVWAGVRASGDAEAVDRLATAVGEALGEVGYPAEARRFHAHVTLGRLRRRPPEDLVEAVLAGRDLDLGREWVSDLKLILSEPGDRGYRYIDLTTVPLGGDPEGMTGDDGQAQS